MIGAKAGPIEAECEHVSGDQEREMCSFRREGAHRRATPPPRVSMGVPGRSFTVMILLGDTLHLFYHDLVCVRIEVKFHFDPTEFFPIN